MSDVSSYEFKALERRVEALEKENLRKLKEHTERLRRQTDAIMRWTLTGIIFVAVIVWTVILTLEISGKK